MCLGDTGCPQGLGGPTRDLAPHGRATLLGTHSVSGERQTGTHKPGSLWGSHPALHPRSRLLPISHDERPSPSLTWPEKLGLAGQNSPLYWHTRVPPTRPTLAPCHLCVATPHPDTPADPLSSPHKALQERRARCETQNIDPVVWTNQRVLKWVRDIDLKVRGGDGLGATHRHVPIPCTFCAHFVGVGCPPRLLRVPASCRSRGGSAHPAPAVGPPLMMPFS